jgi:hypothetical protein
MSKPRQLKTGQKDLFRIGLDNLVNPGHQLVLLANKIEWEVFEDYFDK